MKVPLRSLFPAFILLPGCSRVSGCALAIGLTMAAVAGAASPESEARTILDTSGIQGGLVVHVGSGDGSLTAALRGNDSYQVQGLDPDSKKVASAREFIRSKGVYGEVSVDQLEGKLLPYIDGIINLVVAEDLQGVPMAEVMRVLCPNGVAMLRKDGKWNKTVKPKPSSMDDWTHYYYDAKGNAVSHDDVVGPPDRLQWVGSPRWSRHHDRMSSTSAMISSAGRLFYIMDEGSRISILLPSKWSLISRDAYNGTILWKKPIEQWQTQMWPLKSGPTQLARRLVGDGDKIYVTMGMDAPVSCLNGATGAPIRVYQQTRGAEEILHVNGVLYVLVNTEPWVLTDFAPKFNTGDQKRVETEFNWDEKPRDLVAVDAASSRELWRKARTKVAPLTMATDGRRLIYHDGDRLVCLDPSNGKERWSSDPAGKRKLFEFNYGPRLVLSKDVALYAGGDGAMKGYNADTGKELWSAPHNKSGYRSPEDVIVASGLVWNAPTTSGQMSGAFTGRDLLTGVVKVEFPPDVDTYWFHHRCYIAKATEKYIIPSRTGIEFVDIDKKHWDINHWVRGACLYGVLPCNGLVYAGPHNCACYPEAKLDGMNALAPAGVTSHPKPMPDDQRLERGPAYGQPLAETEPDARDWPTYRHDSARSGYSSQDLVADLGKAWELSFGGRLSAPIVTAGKVFVAEVDRHTLHALDASSGKSVWKYTIGARVDSPPTYWKGRVIFGGMDGNVHCLRASDGALIWRFRGAPANRRHVAFEQLESVWPVHGSVLVDKGVASFVAGRSVFLDGGMRFIRLDAATGKKLVETVMDDKDPDTGRDLQELVKILQMPVGLNDILSCDGKYTYLRSQKFDTSGKRIDVAPVSGNAIEQGAAQKGEGAHIFAPMGFLDDSWFHRSYWVYGKHFAGGHNGYYQAGKYTPSGRIMVFDDKNVYSYGREAQYFKWTTTMEHQLFATSKEAPNVEPELGAADNGKKKAAQKGAQKNAQKAASTTPAYPSVSFADVSKLDPSNKPLTVEAWILPDTQNGAIFSHGGPQNGYAMALEDGKPAFLVRSAGTVAVAASARPLDEGWHHIAGVLTEGKKLRIYVDGQLAAENSGPGYVAKKPAQGLQIGAPFTGVGTYGKGAPYVGLIDQFAIFTRELGEAEINEHATKANGVKRGNGAMIAISFDNGDARDESGNEINGVSSGVETGKGKVGLALWFRKGTTAPPVVAGAAQPTGGPQQGGRGTFVQNQWANRVPIVTRSMTMAGKYLIISGPKDSLDEEYAFERLTQKDPAIQEELKEQDAALDGKRGAIMWTVSTETGKFGSSFKMDSPPVWDGTAIAQGRLFVSSVDGKITCYGRK
jgi:outer membrane protein assembly factor BamB